MTVLLQHSFPSSRGCSSCVFRVAIPGSSPHADLSLSTPTSTTLHPRSVVQVSHPLQAMNLVDGEAPPVARWPFARTV